jgi:hypothetical protein
MDEAVAALDSMEKIPKLPTIEEIRSEVLWGNLMGGGAGVEYYFGYRLPQNDLNAQDWRSRELTWDYSRYALVFFSDNEVPFWEMFNADALAGNEDHDNSVYCFAKPGEIYVVYFSAGASAKLDLSDASGSFKVSWYNPRSGGGLQQGSVAEVKGGAKVDLGGPPADPDQDWVVLVR